MKALVFQGQQGFFIVYNPVPKLLRKRCPEQTPICRPTPISWKFQDQLLSVSQMIEAAESTKRGFRHSPFITQNTPPRKKACFPGAGGNRCPAVSESVKVLLWDNSLHIPYRGCTLYRFPSFLNCPSHRHPWDRSVCIFRTRHTFPYRMSPAEARNNSWVSGILRQGRCIYRTPG